VRKTQQQREYVDDWAVLPALASEEENVKVLRGFRCRAGFRSSDGIYALIGD
jgi:hypothetical protein